MHEREAMVRQLHGAPSHKHLLHSLEGIDAARAGQLVGRSPHSIFQVLRHMQYWLDITLQRLDGRPQRPAAAALGWASPAAPREGEWADAVAMFDARLQALAARIRDPKLDLTTIVQPDSGVSAREEILMIQGHNSYHLGQIVVLRQELGCWPPPRGGDTW
ncbi:MAG TPA: DinB family protein [Planctomycetota bacterium]